VLSSFLQAMLVVIIMVNFNSGCQPCAPSGARPSAERQRDEIAQGLPQARQAIPSV